jgi:ubiquinol-cytochrome c reductase cytochrome c subunit
MLGAALLCAGFAIAVWAQPPTVPDSAAAPHRMLVAAPGSEAAAGGSKLDEGRQLFEADCSSCHGFKGEGVKGVAPSLKEAGEGAADFYLRTGRMPLSRVGDEPVRGEPRYDNGEIEALDAFVGSLGPGPGIPNVEPDKGSLSEGMEMFTDKCAGCHAISGKGGVAIGGYAPPLGEATPTEVGEAIRVGPYLMPKFSEADVTPADVNSLARYVELTQEPEDAGGLGIGHIGPVPEGMVAWFAAIVALLLVSRVIGERLGGGRDDDEAEEPR